MIDSFDDAVQQVIAQSTPECRDSIQGDIAALRSRGVDSWPDLLAVLTDRSAGEDRVTACWLLGCIGDEDALGPLTAALHDADTRLRGEAARALGALGSPRVVPELIAALQTDADADTRMAAAYALGLLGDPRGVDPLLSKLADTAEDAGVRGSAAEALIGPGEQRVVPPLIAALSDSSVEVRFWAAFALGQLGDSTALSELERLARTDNQTLPGWWSVGKEAAAAIERITAGPRCTRPTNGA